jgi:hypothetical protein
VDSTGATETTPCEIGKYNDVVGSSTCKSCELYDKGENNPRYYTIDTGRADCDAAACNDAKAKAVKKYYPETGECVCKGMWLDQETGGQDGFRDDDGALGMDCRDEQRVERAMKFAYSFFGFLVAFVLPLMFGSGALAVLSGVWRRDVAIIVHGLR